MKRPGLTARTKQGYYGPDGDRLIAMQPGPARPLRRGRGRRTSCTSPRREPRIGPDRDGAPRRRRARAHLPHRHADDGGGHAPLVGTTAAISAFVWLLGLAYLYVELTTDERAMGVFVASLLAALGRASRRSIPTSMPRPPVLRSPLFTVHVLSLLFAYASFALACVLGITYVLLFKEIKAKHLGFFYARLPSLQVLDVMNGRAIDVGWLFLTRRPARRRHLGDAGAAARRIRGRRRCRSPIRRSSSRCLAGASTRSRCSRGGRSAGAAAAPRSSRRSGSRSCC